ncbi:CDP-glycerol glycerophosphotransferase family protein [Paenibacillus paeoniae]|uniref:CDP-glycerol glycerophosphotransferase family protein n=1 Tax=Paenibacillus paeoniae TaxID=2292705 RepID=UPI001401D38F|nr:CDP-glycerol glycerophosphotransferase family protein [Paenibacillus paeoniae]
MRVERKKQTIELVDTLKEALQYLNTPAGSAAGFLQDDCLACISAVSSVMEEVEDKEYAALAETCQIHIKQGDFGKAYTLADSLSQWIFEKVQIHYEIVFLPYKADMWDALDSVWRAAHADPSCVVRTIPIPYQSLDPQLNALTDEYEGDRFPSYVDITPYRDYDLSLQNPDVIFIHNPYDEFNRVTRVHPVYFSSNLIKFTDKLVYIPYFISTDKFPDHARFPAFKNSWKIFVQSENARQDILESKEIRPEQVVSMGSPKLDYLYNRIQNNAPMPAKWKAALNGRKVFLYNSSIARIMNDREDIIKSMQEIFRAFQTNKNIAIIWRPHPLSIQTIKSMKPHLLNSYLSLVKAFKKMSNAVYDESSDMYTAIIHSDAYIGDFSSVIASYAVTGKPILKLMPNMKSSFDYWGVSPAWLDYKEETTIPVAVNPGIVVDKELLFPANNRGAAFALDLASEQLRLTKVISQEIYKEPQLYAKACAYQDTLWFVPKRASKVFRYDQTTGETKEYSLPSTYRCEGQYHFTTGIQHDHYLWMLPAQSNMIVRLHMETGEMTGYKLCSDTIMSADQGLFCSNGVIHNNYLWIALNGRQALIQMNLISGEMMVHELSFLQESISAITSDGQALWIVTQTPKVIKWDPESNDTFIFDDWPKGFKEGERPFSSAVFDGENVWLVPCDANMIMKISSSTGEMTAAYSKLKKSAWAAINSSFPFDSIERNRALNANQELFSGAIINKDWIWFCPITAPAMLGVHLITGEIKKIEVKLSRSQDGKTLLVSRYPNPPQEGADLRSTFDNRSLPLKSFIDMVCMADEGDWSNKQCEEACASIANADGTSGEKIWSYVAEYLNR